MVFHASVGLGPGSSRVRIVLGRDIIPLLSWDGTPEENSNLQNNAMNITLLKGVIALIPAGMLLRGFVALFVGKKSE